jgi:hypothetical protein
MDESEQRLRTERWKKWDADFWSGIDAALGDSEAGGHARKYKDVWIIVDFITDEGLLNFGVVDAANIVAGAVSIPSLSLQAFWDRHEPSELVAKVLEMVQQQRSDPISRLMHRHERG